MDQELESLDFLPATDWRLERLARGLGATLDAAAIRVIAAMMTRAPVDTRQQTREHLLELMEVYARPELVDEPERFYRPPALPDVEVRAVRARPGLPGLLPSLDLRFASDYEPYARDYAEAHLGWHDNLMVHARWYRCARPRATVVCVHGFGGGPFAIEGQTFAARRLLRAGVDVVLTQLPFHGHRRPRSLSRTVALFPSPDVVRTIETFGQAVHELRALLRWLRARGAAPAGLLGHSLGGYTSALTAGLEDGLAFVAAISPPARLSEMMWRHGEGLPLRVQAEAAGFTLADFRRLHRVHCPLERPARVARERRFLVAGRGDLLMPTDQARALWEHWERPGLYWYPGSHVAQLGRGGAFRALVAWLGGLGLARPQPQDAEAGPRAHDASFTA